MLDTMTEKEVLPIGDEDRAIPTKIHDLDIHIGLLKENLAHLQAQIADSESDRRLMVVRAKEVHVTTDSEWKIVETPIYPKKKVDVAALKKLEPDRYVQIISNICSRLTDKTKAEMGKAETFISQADVKAVIRDKGILAMVIPEPSEPLGVEVSVVKR